MITNYQHWINLVNDYLSEYNLTLDDIDDFDPKKIYRLGISHFDATRMALGLKDIPGEDTHNQELPPLDTYFVDDFIPEGYPVGKLSKR